MNVIKAQRFYVLEKNPEHPQVKAMAGQDMTYSLKVANRKEAVFIDKHPVRLTQEQLFVERFDQDGCKAKYRRFLEEIGHDEISARVASTDMMTPREELKSIMDALKRARAESTFITPLGEHLEKAYNGMLRIREEIVEVVETPVVEEKSKKKLEEKSKKKLEEKSKKKLEEEEVKEEPVVEEPVVEEEIEEEEIEEEIIVEDESNV